MTRQDVINNIRANYGRYGLDMAQIEENIVSGEQQGFTYLTIYTGLRMALSTAFGVQEYFTVQEMAEALGTTEEEIIKEIENMRTEAEEIGLDPDELAYKTEPGEITRFIIPAGALF